MTLFRFLQAGLAALLNHFGRLRGEFGWQSRSMAEF